MVDVLIVALLALAIIGGYRRGFIATLYGLITWIVALAGALVLQAEVAEWLSGLLGLAEPVVRILAFVGLVLAIEIALAAVGRALISPLIRTVHSDKVFGTVDRVLGIVPGVMRSLLIIAIALAALLVLPVGNDVRAAVDGSRIARVLIAEISAVQPYLGSLVGEAGGAPLLVTRLGEEDRQSLDLPEDLQLESDPEAARQLVELVNEERVARGLSPLELDERLIPVAEAHSTEMFRLRYFSHQSPNTGSPFDRIAAAGIQYSRAGENLAYARSVATAHRGLMESPGHRENILRPEFTRIGIGVISAGPYGRMFTQLFLTP